ncbi:hypothetical protein AWV80_31495 [Cupriavidus sp. UYMU48A]|nr:hypothetical protein AWV80_31495 [Cupriavidus sp. UYMU48A]
MAARQSGLIPGVLRTHVATATEVILSDRGNLIQLAGGQDWGAATHYESWFQELAKANFSDHMRIISTES